MTSFERRQSLLEVLRKQPGLRVSEIAKVLGVSEGTVQNDLNALEEKVRLESVHERSILVEQNQFPNESFIKIQLPHT